MAHYGADLAAIHAAAFTALAEGAARALLERLPAPARVVDLGCGDGTTAALLAAAGHDVLGIDRSPDMAALARRRAPGATFRVGAFPGAALPEGCDAIVAAGEVLGYLAPDGLGLDAALAAAAAALRRGGLLLFDLAGPGRVPPGGRAACTIGDGWAVLAESRPRGRVLERRIVTFRAGRRTEELHRLALHAPRDVLARLRAAGFTARRLAGGYPGAPLPPGLTAYLARRR